MLTLGVDAILKGNKLFIFHQCIENLAALHQALRGFCHASWRNSVKTISYLYLNSGSMSSSKFRLRVLFCRMIEKEAFCVCL